MAIAGASAGAPQGAGGLEAFQRLRAQAKQKLEMPGARPAIQEADAFAAAKARALQAAGARLAAESGATPAVAVNYQRSGAMDKGESRPRLGQYVDLVA